MPNTLYTAPSLLSTNTAPVLVSSTTKNVPYLRDAASPQRATSCSFSTLQAARIEVSKSGIGVSGPLSAGKDSTLNSPLARR